MGRQVMVHAAVGVLLGTGLLAPGGAEGVRTAPLGTFTEAYVRSAATMSAAGEPYASWAASGRRFLAFDPRGDGTAVEAVGDLATAGRIVVLVPGVDSTLRDFDRGLGGIARRAPAVQARSLCGALRVADPAARVAVVAWLGYDAPEGVGLEAARDVRARAGAAALAAFVAAVARQRPAATVVLVGHSYGAIVVGLAAPHVGPAVTDLVALGAPGMGVDRAADLGTSARVWSALAGTDWIRRVPPVRLGRLGHGVPPSANAFGARPLPAERVRGHDGYLDPGTDTLVAVAAVVLGAPLGAGVGGGR
ncbi:MAG TPA: alpha/beta hydrolase [Micromonosporaceae bacterium]|nr:alpha/beta hydrolase [Micromonosporaceae bacterium]